LDTALSSKKILFSDKNNYKRLLSLALPEWKTLALATVFLVLASSSGLAFPQFVRDLLDGALQELISFIVPGSLGSRLEYPPQLRERVQRYTK